MNHSMLTTLSTLVLAGGIATAAGPSHWTHTDQSDFAEGHLEHVVATNHGDLKLSRQVETLLEQDERVSAIYIMAELPDGTVYAGTGPNGVLLKISDGKITTAADFGTGSHIFALLVGKNGKDLWIGVSGESARLIRLTNGKQTEVFTSESAQYIWSIQQASDEKLYLATGPDGQLIEIDTKGNSRVVYDSDENNLLSLAITADDQLIAGTDPNGLLLRINRDTGDAFVLYDAEETEISVITIDKAGNIYAGTAAAVQESGYPGHFEAAPGRPESEGGEPFPTIEPDAPQPPELPDPTPAEPDPIPTGTIAPDATDADADAPARLLSRSGADADGLQVEDTPPGDDGEPDQDAPGEPAEDHPGHADSEVIVVPATEPAPHYPVGGQTATPAAGGNAVYRVDARGFVHEIFRDDVLILSLVEQDGDLIVGTGSSGLVYLVRPAADETIVIADVEAQQVMSLLRSSSGIIYAGLANTGGLVSLSPGYASEGTFTSAVLDAGQVSQWGHLSLQGTLPSGTSLRVATRSGNTSDPDGTGWSPWTEPASATRYMAVRSPNARFLQYRLEMTGHDTGTTPTVEEVNIAYQGPNLPPTVSSVTVMNPKAVALPVGELDVQTHYTVSWNAFDPDGDTLTYQLDYRLGRSGQWIKLADDLESTDHSWNIRNVPDGRYQVRVTASDKASNFRGQERTASRISDPVVVDNTPPVIGDFETAKLAKGVQVKLRAVDRLSPIVSIQYSVNASDDWQAVPASDNIYDTPEERADFAIDGLSAGVYQITVRVTDSQANAAFETFSIVVD